MGMGRNRAFDEAQVLARAAAVFRTSGYEGTGVDELLTAVGLHRGSLYKAFGSKRGLFVAALEQELARPVDDEVLDLVLVALLEFGLRDPQIRDLLARRLAGTGVDGPVLGNRLLARAGIDVAISPSSQQLIRKDLS